MNILLAASQVTSADWAILGACFALAAATGLFIFYIRPDASDLAPHRSKLDQLLETSSGGTQRGGTTTQGQSAATQRSNGTGDPKQTERGGDGKTTVAGDAVNPGPTFDPFPRVRPQGDTAVARSSPSRDAKSDRPSTPGKSAPISSTGDAARNLTTGALTSTSAKKKAEAGPGFIAVSIDGAGEAEVYIDGRSRGRAPLTWQGSAGRHIVTLRPASPFTPTLIEVKITPGSTVQAVFAAR